MDTIPKRSTNPIINPIALFISSHLLSLQFNHGFDESNPYIIRRNSDPPSKISIFPIYTISSSYRIELSCLFTEVP
jgi:hypothetical protein